jgi:hypothetical protein
MNKCLTLVHLTTGWITEGLTVTREESGLAWLGFYAVSALASTVSGCLPMTMCDPKLLTGPASM